MPTYVYRNLVSGETFEFEQRITESALTADPRTGEPVKRLIQPVGIVFKGSGFYINDSRSGSAKGESAKGESAKGESTKATSGKSESAASKSSSAD